MKQMKYQPNFGFNERNTIYTGGPVSKGFYERNLLKARPVYLNNCCKTPKYFYRRKQDRAFNQLINNYFEDYNKFQKAHKFIQKKPYKREESEIDYNQYELKRKNLSVLFFKYELMNNEDKEFNFELTDKLIESMNNGKDDTLIKTTQIKNDYEIRLNKNKRREPQYNNFINNIEDNKNKNKGENKDKLKRENIQFKEEISSGDQSSQLKNKSKTIKKSDEEENIFYLDNGDLIINDNYLEFSNNIYLDKNSPLLKDIINSNFKDDYTVPEYNIPQSAIDEKEEENRKKQDLNKYEGGELKRFQDMIISNEYPAFEQLTNPYYPTNYVPPPCFPKMPEDEEEERGEDEEYDDFGFNENDNKKAIEEDENALKLLSNEITNDEYPMFEHLIRNDFKGKYVPPTYKIPSNIQKDIEKEKEKKEKQQEDYERNKNLNVRSDINRYDEEQLKMMDDILRDNKNPLFEQLINPYYPTEYKPPEVFPKPENFEENNEEEYYGHGDFEMISQKQVEGNNDDNAGLIRNELLNKEYPMFDNLIKNDFKGNYAPPVYKKPDFMESEEKVDINERNKQNFEEMKGNYVNYDEHKGNEYPTVNQMVNNNYDSGKIDEKKDNKLEENDEESYDDFEK